MKKKITLISLDEVGKEMSIHVKNVLKVIANEYGHEFTITKQENGSVDQSDDSLKIACLSSEDQIKEINNGNYNAIVNPLKSYSVLNHYFPLKNKHGDHFNLVVIRQDNESLFSDKSLEVAYHWALDRSKKITIVDNNVRRGNKYNR